VRARACILFWLAALSFSCTRTQQSLELRVRLHGAQVLQIGTPVNIAGARVGEVISVLPLKFEESEVVFRIDDRKAVRRIPSDSTVSIYRTEPGEYFLNLDIHGKTGPAAKDNQWLSEAAGPQP
jgi:ABC-type transporter Mla subunit MlaD